MNDIDKQIAIIMRGIEEILPENILEKKIQKSINNKIPLNISYILHHSLLIVV